jgi:hypothetical protein
MNQTRTFLLFAWLFVAGWLALQWFNPPAKAPADGAGNAGAIAATPPASAADSERSR